MIENHDLKVVICADGVKEKASPNTLRNLLEGSKFFMDMYIKVIAVLVG